MDIPDNFESAGISELVLKLCNYVSKNDQGGNNVLYFTKYLISNISIELFQLYQRNYTKWLLVSCLFHPLYQKTFQTMKHISLPR